MIEATNERLPTPSPGEAQVFRFLDAAKELIYARCRVDGLFEAWQDHVRLWRLPVDGFGEVLMRQALGGAVLYLSSRPRDETAAFTLNLTQPASNVFFTGSSHDCVVTGRYFTEDVKVAEQSRLFVDVRRGKTRHTSVIDVVGVDLLSVLEQYCQRSDQAGARFFEISDDDYLMVASLPNDEREGFVEMTREQALEGLASSKPLDQRDFWFQCGCDPDRMVAAMQSMFEGRRDELFAGDESVVVSCPRCGRNWTIQREGF
ncbi:MAG: Hsp33 family molecular chaperone HslO [Planctomycetes bacterium]|nr:Hsp33 family molecular chaperone HslO [Planctomycetota bacterium]